jgi:putative transposase
MTDNPPKPVIRGSDMAGHSALTGISLTRDMTTRSNKEEALVKFHSERRRARNQHLLEILDVVREFADEWLWTYNNERPNMAIGGTPPSKKRALAA